VMASVTVCGGPGVVGAIFHPIYFNTSFQVVFHKTGVRKWHKFKYCSTIVVATARGKKICGNS
jgi:hypothetical protein